MNDVQNGGWRINGLLDLAWVGSLTKKLMQEFELDEKLKKYSNVNSNKEEWYKNLKQSTCEYILPVFFLSKLFGVTTNFPFKCLSLDRN